MPIHEYMIENHRLYYWLYIGCMFFKTSILYKITYIYHVIINIFSILRLITYLDDTQVIQVSC